MTEYYKKVSEIVRQRGGRVGVLQLWQVVDDKIVMWHPTLGDRPTKEEVDAVQLQEELLTAEQIVSRYFSAYQIAALQRLEYALLQAGKPLGLQMTAAKQWLESVMLSWAASPTPAPAESFGQPQATFAEASGEAVADLASPNPET
jgi:hypothetical protein